MAELDRVEIARRIAQARKAAGLTQPELADILQVHFRTLQTWERGKKPVVPFDRLDEIAKATGATKEWLLHGDESPGGSADYTALAAEVGEIREAVNRLADALEQWMKEQS